MMRLAHFYFVNSGGISTYLEHHISQKHGDSLIALNRADMFTSIPKQVNNLSKGTILCCHDAEILRALLRNSFKNKIAIFLHGDYSYYLKTAEEFGLAVDYIICVTSSIKKQLPGYLSRRTFIQGPVVPLSPYQNPPSTTYLLFIGRATEGKGSHLLPLIDELIKKYHPTLRWNLILGHTDEPPPRNFKEWINSESSRINMFSKIPNIEVQSIVKKSTALILPSFKEGHPLAVAESISNGRPCFTFEYSPDSWTHIPPCPFHIVKPTTSASALANQVVQYLQLSPESKSIIERNNTDFAGTVYSKENKRHSFENWLWQQPKNQTIIKSPILRKLVRKFLFQ